MSWIFNVFTCNFDYYDPNTDTQTLQSVTDEGNSTTNDIITTGDVSATTFNRGTLSGNNTGDQTLQTVTDLGNTTDNSINVSKDYGDLSSDIVVDRLNSASMRFGTLDNTEVDVLGSYNYMDYDGAITGFGTTIQTRGMLNALVRGADGLEDWGYFPQEDHTGMVNSLTRYSAIYSGIGMDVKVTGMENTIDWRGSITENQYIDNEWTGEFIGLKNKVSASLTDDGAITVSKKAYALHNEVGVGADFGTPYAIYNKITSEGDGGWLIYNDGLLGDNLLGQDNVKTFFGTGFDSSILYDGTDFLFNTGLVNPSDLVLDCGTDKTLELAETVWDDLRFPLTRDKQGQSDKPDFDFTNIGLLFPQNIPTEIVYIIGQFTHERKNGSDIKPHIHFVQTSASTPIFKIDYRWYKNGQDPSGSFTTLTASTFTFTYVSGSIMQIVSFPTISGTAIDTVSSIIEIKLYRDDNVAIGDVLTKEFDIHYQKDTIGSRQEFVK